MLIADGFNAAIIGVGSRPGHGDIFVYSVRRCIDILMSEGPMSYEEAEEYFRFNVAGAWVGEGTPLFVDELEQEDVLEIISQGD